VRAGERGVERDETDNDDDHGERQAPRRGQHHARGVPHRRKREQRRGSGQATTDQISESEAVGERLRHAMAATDQVAAARGRKRDQNREAEPTADLP
jgi:hypothetical protein